MKLSIRLVTPALLLASMTPVPAQNETRLGSDFRREGEELKHNCSTFKSFFGCAQTLFTGKPLHIAAGSIAPGNGVGVGGAFVFENNLPAWRLNTNADAVGSFNGSWRAGLYVKAVKTPTRPDIGVITQPPPAGAAPILQPRPSPELNFYLQGISLAKVGYYGLGQLTSRNSLALFSMRETIAGVNAAYPLFGASGLALFGELNGRFVSIGGRTGDTAPSIGRLYNNLSAPGLADQPGFIQFGEGVRFARAISDRLRLRYSALYQQFVAPADSTYSFRRLSFDFSHEVPFYRNMSAGSAHPTGPDQSPPALEQRRYTRNREGSLTLEAMITTSYTGDRSVVPFYFQPTLGGSDINGARGLPSYSDYRFRAPNLMLFRAAVEHSIWGPVGAAFGADFGRVAVTRGDLGFDHMRHSWAGGITIRAGGLPQVWLLFAWGGGEGSHTIAYIDPMLLGGSMRPSLY